MRGPESGSVDIDQVQDEVSVNHEGLTISEDRELRQLTWFSQAGSVSDSSRARVLELTAKDRRREIREPRPNPGSDPEDDLTGSLFDEPEGTSSTYCPRCGSTLLRY